jgi:hypothetical protein
MIIRIADFTSLADAVTGLGAEMPQSVTDVLAGVKTFRKAATGGGADPHWAMRDAIRGGPVEVEDARDLLMSMAVAQLAGPQLAEYLVAHRRSGYRWDPGCQYPLRAGRRSRPGLGDGR